MLMFPSEIYNLSLIELNTEPVFQDYKPELVLIHPEYRIQ